MSSTIQVRVDDELRAQSDKLFKELGTDTTTAIRIFLTQAVAYQGFPFEVRKNGDKRNPYKALTKEEILMILEASREQAANGKVKNAADVVSDLKGKYGL